MAQSMARYAAMQLKVYLHDLQLTPVRKPEKFYDSTNRFAIFSGN